jgi:hypothetical protein
MHLVQECISYVVLQKQACGELRVVSSQRPVPVSSRAGLGRYRPKLSFSILVFISGPATYARGCVMKRNIDCFQQRDAWSEENEKLIDKVYQNRMKTTYQVSYSRRCESFFSFIRYFNAFPKRTHYMHTQTHTHTHIYIYIYIYIHIYTELSVCL